MRIARLFILAVAVVSAGAGQSLTCDLAAYKPQEGLQAQIRSGVLTVNWNGERGEQLRAGFAIQNGRPVVTELAARGSGAWIVLGRNLSPEFEITSGVRRLSQQQIDPLVNELHIQLTPEVVEREKWNAFWDAPLMVPGRPGTNLGLPRKPEEVRRAWAPFIPPVARCEPRAHASKSNSPA